MSKKNTQINFQFCISNAEGFYFMGKMAAKQSTLNKEQGYIWIPVGAVNFSFAIELLLKATLFYDLRKKFHGHELLNLYSKLTEETKIKIGNSYRTHLNENKNNNDLPDYKIIIRKADDDRQETNKVNFESIEEMLRIHNDSFENWRYLHEFYDGLCYQFNYKSMDAFYMALVDILKIFLSKERQTYGMRSVAH